MIAFLQRSSRLGIIPEFGTDPRLISGFVFHDFWAQIAIAALMLFYTEPEEAVPLREHTASDFWWNWWLL